MRYVGRVSVVGVLGFLGLCLVEEFGGRGGYIGGFGFLETDWEIWRVFILIICIRF